MAYHGGLTKWFKEDWRDVKTGEKCGRKSAKKSERAYPACRPKAVADKMSTAEKKKMAKKKTSSKKVKWSTTASEKKRK